MKIIYLILATLFVTFTLFQTNDPGSPIIWILLYGYTALIAFLMFTGTIKSIIPPVIGVIVYTIQAVTSWPRTFVGMESTMSIMKPEIENARETSGMLICAAIMVFFIIMIKKRRVTSAVL